jgi:hypothetical protein
MTLPEALTEVERLTTGREYDKDGFNVVLEMYWHEGEFYAHAYVNATIIGEGGAEGSASDERLAHWTLADALENALESHKEN